MIKPQGQFDPLASPTPLIVYIDYKSPYAYLAKDPTYALEDELGIEIDWRPLTLDIASYLGSARLDRQDRVVESQRTEGQWRAVKYSYSDVRRYGSLRGLVVRGTTKIWDSSLAAIGMLWAKAQGSSVLRSYTDIVYERFWKRELDIEDPALIERVLEEAGANIVGFSAYATGEGRLLNDHLQRVIFDAGIFGVPTYVVDNEIYFGREHLPRVRWHLTGRKGPAPDVAYESHGFAPISACNRRDFSVAIDFKNAYAYLAFGPTSAMAEELGISVDWQPFIGAPWKDPAQFIADDRGTRHRRFRAEYSAHDVARYAASQGLVIRRIYRETDSTLAAIGLLWTKRSPAFLTQAYVQRLFEGYWREELDIENRDAIVALLAELGASTAGFESFIRQYGPAELERVRQNLLQSGVYDVPAFRTNDQTFVGRPHLPLIRAILSTNN